MKTVLKSLIFVLGMSSVAGAAIIQEASVNHEDNTLHVLVTYTGGCEEHEFALEQNPMCLETFPVQCSATLLHNDNGDTCEALISREVVFDLDAEGLTNPYYSGAFYTIRGAGGSSATVNLPQ